MPSLQSQLSSDVWCIGMFCTMCTAVLDTLGHIYGSNLLPESHSRRMRSSLSIRGREEGIRIYQPESFKLKVTEMVCIIKCCLKSLLWKSLLLWLLFYMNSWIHIWTVCSAEALTEKPALASLTSSSNDVLPSRLADVCVCVCTYLCINNCRVGEAVRLNKTNNVF